MKYLLTTLIIVCIAFSSNAQLGNLGKKLKDKINKKVENKVDKTIDKGLDKTEEEIEESVKGENKKDKENNEEPDTKDENAAKSNEQPSGKTSSSNSKASFSYSTKFDFVPGDKIMLLEDFHEDYVGDFPAGWNTNGSGEIVKLNNSDEKWFKMKSNSVYIPDLPKELPEEYTIEFDLAIEGVTRSTSSVSGLHVTLDDNNGFKYGRSTGLVDISPCQYTSVDVRVKSYNDGDQIINNTVQSDIREAFMNQPHISIAVNKQRYRMWINEKKYIDIPRFLPENKIKYIKFEVVSLDDEKGENMFLKNLKIAEGGLDLRDKLLKEGKVSTNGILFNVNSDIVKPESYGVIRNISQVLESDSNIKLLIIGHTDSDGDDDANMTLSKKRAESVKKILTTDFNVDGSRLTTDGKGESEPVVSNDTPANKASNRRVEFVVVK